MAILPIRRLGDIGIITDANPYDLPQNALSQGNNVRFQNGKITRGPVFKSVLDTTAATPVFTFTFSKAGDTDIIGIVNEDGTIYHYQNGVETDVTPGSLVPGSSADPFTYCNLGNVGYLNRMSGSPLYFVDGMTDWDELPNWPATYTCKVFRAYKNFLIALNVNKGAAENPTLVKWSDVTVMDSVPASWDETDPTLSAGENPIAEMTTEILDGLPLRDAFVIYSRDQAQLMEYTADQNVFRFRKLFDDVGIINTNCVVEVEGKHFVFTPNDIIVHDGISYKSIIKGQNHQYVFRSLNSDKSDKFFVFHDKPLSEIGFCYISGDGEANFLGTDYCNKAAIYNYSNGTWAFRDLPNVGYATSAAMPSATTWAATTPATWSTFGGSWYDMEDEAEKAMFMVGPVDTDVGLTASRLYGYDLAYGGTLTQAVSTEATKEAWVRRIGVDLDETGEQIRAYKVVRTIYPQANALSSENNISFSFGATEFNDQNPALTPPVAFDPTSSHKVDVRVGGRYLAWEMIDTSYFSFQLSGFDIDVSTTGRR